MKTFAFNMASFGLATPRYREQQAWVKTERRKSKLLVHVIALIFLAFFCSLFYIWSRIQMVNVGYEINRELHLKERLLEENKRLTLETATLKSPVRLEALAKREYGMDLPLKSQIVGDPAFQAPAVAKVSTPGVVKVSQGTPAPRRAMAQKTVSPSPLPASKAIASKVSLSKTAPAVKPSNMAEPKPKAVASEKAGTSAPPKTSAKAVTAKPGRVTTEAVTTPRVTKAREPKVAALSNLTMVP